MRSQSNYDRVSLKRLPLWLASRQSAWRSPIALTSSKELNEPVSLWSQRTRVKHSETSCVVQFFASVARVWWSDGTVNGQSEWNVFVTLQGFSSQIMFVLFELAFNGPWTFFFLTQAWVIHTGVATVRKSEGSMICQLARTLLKPKVTLSRRRHHLEAQQPWGGGNL